MFFFLPVPETECRGSRNVHSPQNRPTGTGWRCNFKIGLQSAEKHDIILIDIIDSGKDRELSRADCPPEGESHMMKNKKLLSILLIAVSVISLVGAILMFTVFRSASADSAFRKALGTVCGILLLLISALVLYYVYLIHDWEPNFFLYDKHTHRNIAPDKLTFSTVNDKMTFYVSLIDPEETLLWTTDLLAENDRFGYRSVYRPLVAYKMLFNLIVSENSEDWKKLTEADDQQILYLCEALEQNHEEEMTKAIRYIHTSFRGDPRKMSEFIKGNKKYIQGKMLGYVKRNLNQFY